MLLCSIYLQCFVYKLHNDKQLVLLACCAVWDALGNVCLVCRVWPCMYMQARVCAQACVCVCVRACSKVLEYSWFYHAAELSVNPPLSHHRLISLFHTLDEALSRHIPQMTIRAYKRP